MLKVQSWIRNFFWSGDPLKRGSSLVVWDTCCLPLDQGGLGLKDLTKFNRALLLKNCWRIINASSPSAVSLRSRFFSSDLQVLSYYQQSSIWLGVKKFWNRFCSKLHWLVGDGNSIDFCTDNWLGVPIAGLHTISAASKSIMPVKVSGAIKDKQWSLPPLFTFFFPDIATRINEIQLPLDNVKDQVVWSDNPKT